MTITMPSNYDLLFLAIIGISIIIALFRGAITELLNLATWVTTFWLMRTYGTLISQHLPRAIPQNLLLRNIIIFILIFIAVTIIATILKTLMSQLIKNVGLGGLNYTLGLIFGLLRGVLICAALIIVISMFRLDPDHAYQSSRFYPFLKPGINWIASSIPR
jgi:membrane protein required for colicin V production